MLQRRLPLPAPAGRRGTARGARVIARLRKLCLAFPGAVEKVSHGEPTWFAGHKGKVFAMLDDHHHGAAHLSAWVPLPLGAQDALVARDPERYFRPPYVGGKGWVGIVLDTGADWADVARLLREAYLRVAPARLAAMVAADAPTQPRRASGAAVHRTTTPRRHPARS